MPNTRDTDFWVPSEASSKPITYNGLKFTFKDVKPNDVSFQPTATLSVEQNWTTEVSCSMELIQDLKGVMGLDVEQELINILSEEAIQQFRARTINEMCTDIHQRNIDAGWWSDIETGESLLGKRNLGELLMLVVTEVAEAYEGVRKNLPDDKLPHRRMLEVELADVFIRIFDIAGSEKLDLGGAIMEKLAFNRTREDHKIENRRKANGKKT